MKLLVTGGCGFIGSNFIDFYIKAYPERQVLCLDLMTYAANRKSLTEAEKHDNFTFIQGDIRDSSLIFPLFEKEMFDCVINFAAESHVDRSIENPSLFLDTNVTGTGILLEASVKHHVKRFHQVSTDEVYGGRKLCDRGPLFDETSLLKPSSPYSASKAASDLLALSYCKTFGLPVTVSRSSNNFGPRQHIEKLIPLTVTCILRGNSVPLYGNGENMRDWLHVQDHVKALNLILNKGAFGEIYNISSHNEVSNIKLVKLLLKILKKPESFITFTPDRKGHDERYGIDTDKIERTLGFAPEKDFEKSLEETVKWYISNEEWLKEYDKR